MAETSGFPFFAPVRPTFSATFLFFFFLAPLTWESVILQSPRRFICWRFRLIRGHTIRYCDALLLLARRPTPAIFKNLALNTSSRDSFYSCPDLSTLQISSASAALYGLETVDQGANTEPSRSPSPDPDPRGAKKRSKSQVVSRKARGVIGKVRAFQRIAAAKMAHPAIKIDTSVPATKRELPDGDAGLDIGEQGNPRLEAGNTDDVPPFLCQSVSGE